MRLRHFPARRGVLRLALFVLVLSIFAIQQPGHTNALEETQQRQLNDLIKLRAALAKGDLASVLSITDQVMKADTGAGIWRTDELSDQIALLKAGVQGLQAVTPRVTNLTEKVEVAEQVLNGSSANLAEKLAALPPEMREALSDPLSLQRLGVPLHDSVIGSQAFKALDGGIDVSGAHIKKTQERIYELNRFFGNDPFGNTPLRLTDTGTTCGVQLIQFERTGYRM
jgi:hypothetical protein